MPVSMITAQQCVRDIMQAADRRQARVITPRSYAPVYYLRQLFPGLVDRALVRMFTPRVRDKK